MTACASAASLERVRAGEPILLVDGARPADAPHLVAAGERITTRSLEFLTVHGGLVCLVMPLERLRALEIAPDARARHGLGGYAMSPSIDAAADVAASWSLAGRARTMRTACAAATSADELLSPGHVIALAVPAPIAGDAVGAAQILAAAAGLQPAAAICTVVRPDLRELAGIPRVEVGALAAHLASQRPPPLTAQLPTPSADFVSFAFPSDDEGHVLLALTLGDPARHAVVDVAVHAACVLGDTFGSLACGCRASLDESVERLRAEGVGVLLYDKHEGGPPSCPAGRVASASVGEHAAAMAQLGVRGLRLHSRDPALARRLRDLGFDVQAAMSVAPSRPASMRVGNRSSQPRIAPA